MPRSWWPQRSSWAELQWRVKWTAQRHSFGCKKQTRCSSDPHWGMCWQKPFLPLPDSEKHGCGASPPGSTSRNPVLTRAETAGARFALSSHRYQQYCFGTFHQAAISLGHGRAPYTYTIQRYTATAKYKPACNYLQSQVGVYLR